MDTKDSSSVTVGVQVNNLLDTVTHQKPNNTPIPMVAQDQQQTKISELGISAKQEPIEESNRAKELEHIDLQVTNEVSKRLDSREQNALKCLLSLTNRPINLKQYTPKIVHEQEIKRENNNKLYPPEVEECPALKKVVSSLGFKGNLNTSTMQAMDKVQKRKASTLDEPIKYNIASNGPLPTSTEYSFRNGSNCNGAINFLCNGVLECNTCEAAYRPYSKSKHEVTRMDIVNRIKAKYGNDVEGKPLDSLSCEDLILLKKKRGICRGECFSVHEKISFLRKVYCKVKFTAASVHHGNDPRLVKSISGQHNHKPVQSIHVRW